MGSAACYNYFINSCLAYFAGKAGSVINSQLVYEFSHIAVSVAEIAEGGAAAGDGTAKGPFDHGQQAGGFFISYFFANSCRMDAGGKKGLIDIDVAQAGDAGLVKQ